MKTGRYSLNQLLDNSNISQIVIPEMQRDYVWSVDNTRGLLSSIKKNYDSKSTLTLSIKCEGKEIDEVTKKFLSKEYERIRFNTRIGFIYAYFDSSDSSLLYLIDGQQRMTTLFLLLLACYSLLSDENKTLFQKIYFKDNKPKLDYKVRETAHRFLIDFIKFSLKYSDKNFKTDSENYYSLYDNDPTVQSILNNYSYIKEWLLANIIVRQNDKNDKEINVTNFLDYVENFIEFNYFDTGLSRQGERLYLYMNSRGEQLSTQEKIRPTIIQRSENEKKLQAGKSWEIWQHFFWLKRRNNPNSDIGFLGFLKIAVILHQEVFKSKNLRFKEISLSKPQSILETRAEYISDLKSESQRTWIYQYIDDNISFDYEWISRIFNAFKKVNDIYDSSIIKPLRNDEWFYKFSIPTINYLPLLGMILLSYYFPDSDNANIYRLGIYLMSRSDDPLNNKQPDRAVIRGMELVSSMYNTGICDVRNLTAVNLDNNKNMDDSKSLMWKLIKYPEWENLFCEIVSNRNLNQFFHGTHDLLFRLFTESDETDKYEISEFIEFKNAFVERFINKKGKNRIKEILNYGDISICAGNDTSKFGKNMSQWKFPVDDEWLVYLFNQKGKREIMRNYILEKSSSIPNDYLPALRKGVDFMSEYYYKYLWQDAGVGGIYPHIIVLSRCLPKWNLSVELPAYLLKTKIKDAWNWSNDNEKVNNFCVVDFYIKDKKMIKVANAAGQYAVDFVYIWDNWKPKWEVFLKNRKEDVDKEVWARLSKLKNKFELLSDSSRLKFKVNFYDELGYDENGMLESIQQIIEWFKIKEISLARLINYYKSLEQNN